jgi:hypothetical protein
MADASPAGRGWEFGSIGREPECRLLLRPADLGAAADSVATSSDDTAANEVAFLSKLTVTGAFGVDGAAGILIC